MIKQFITAGALKVLNNGSTGFMGVQIMVKTAITVTELQRWIVAGNSKSHVLKIVDEKNRTITQGTLNTLGKTPGQFASAPIKPVVLSPGTTYYILSQELKGGDKWYHLVAVTGDDNAVATVGKSAYMTADTVATTGKAGEAYGPVGLKYQPTCQAVVGDGSKVLNDMFNWVTPPQTFL